MAIYWFLSANTAPSGWIAKSKRSDKAQPALVNRH
jgi:hypothetical protein